ncbi:MAG: hypothetical protein ACD_31C00002G0024 [uncultured bacterium]|uniref:Phospho-N-acetylmuramoyl-pentapeptide-transferase n=4 Tax=Candidatus Daviesiibacteriota TaxID=1752718 RepID=A0A0G0H5F3_9BACT|nr:MAG: hypothetical protein ACD_31C00002G0024 [uncultured bacterium]KKQ07304.1 MAG: Phospho-N-acetylmuramoyl-pentapeptide-transferase [Candidatus Daviesbacteria bacterium GW2011_GWB1_36_5]KKQ15651.1 MAG: Phospho-N-acetylmuramoyl-pentapeptide-transferase [Candidatus Daviesbacteria bacterium GW2011_GWA1_36_8]OGE17492.1 MAG: hypothetical protein A2858_01120 [Candidatus Daviesbacteria bacterium RIFCSPHIGHO2_01_FULL_36_37]OGE36587.1 MAG: hypothetical protein A3E66_02965 [Candidatus Daviesbacteria b
MIELLGLVLISFLITSILLVPYIDFLYHLRKKNLKKLEIHHSEVNIEASKNRNIHTPITNKLLGYKDIDTPVGGGLLIIPVTIILTILTVLFTDIEMSNEIYLLIFTLISFGLIGFVDDIRKIFALFYGKYHGIRGRYLLILQLIFASLIACALYFVVGINNLYVPIFGNVVLGSFYIPLAVFIIVSFANAYNISDGLDGLSSGLLMICLFAFLALASASFNQYLSVFVGVWIGALIAFLYFNVYPARIYLGDAGAYGFGAALAVVGLLTGKVVGLAVIGGMYIIIVASSLIQILSKRFLHKKILPVTPIHMYFKFLGWEEPKIVFRFWLAGIIFAFFGLWLALLSS